MRDKIPFVEVLALALVADYTPQLDLVGAVIVAVAGDLKADVLLAVVLYHAVLADAGVAYEALEWRQPDLEDVYLALTGTDVGAGGEPVERGAETIEGVEP